MRKLFIALVIITAVAVFGVVAENTYAGPSFGKITVNVLDADGDGCNDRVEQSEDEILGGRRDPTNPWDFYDPNGDRIVDLINDVFIIADAFDLVPGDPGYSTALDRSPPPSAAEEPDPTKREPWDMGPPDGIIDLVNDIFGVAHQFDHECQGSFSETIDLDAECNSIVKEMGEPEEEFELAAGETHVECFLERNPDTGEVVNVDRTVTTNMGSTFEGMGDEEIIFPQNGGTGEASGVPIGYYRCESEKKYESLIFRTDLAKVRLVLRWWAVIDQNNPYYGGIGFRETWKEVGAIWPWSITDRNDTIDVSYTDSYQVYRLQARTWSAFRYEVRIPMPFGIPSINITRDMEIHVSTTAGLNSEGVATCWNRGYNT